MTRNKSCASNRGCTAPLGFTSEHLTLLRLDSATRPAHPRERAVLLSSILKPDVLIGFLIGCRNLITSGTIKHPWKGKECRRRTSYFPGGLRTMYTSDPVRSSSFLIFFIRTLEKYLLKLRSATRLARSLSFFFFFLPSTDSAGEGKVASS